MYRVVTMAAVLIVASTAQAQPKAWISHTGIGTSIIDTDAQSVIATLPNSVSGHALFAAPTLTYVTDNKGYPTPDDLIVLDAATGAEVGRGIGLALNARDIALSADGTKAFITDQVSHRVRVVDTSTLAVTNSITALGAFHIQARDGLLFVTGSAITYVIDVATETVLADIRGHLPLYKADSIGDKLFAPSVSRQNVAVIDLNTFAVVNTIPMGGFTRNAQQIGNEIWVSMANNDIKIIDPVAETVIATISGFVRPYNMDLTPDGTQVYVSPNAGNSVKVVDIASRTIVASITTVLTFANGTFIAAPPAQPSTELPTAMANANPNPACPGAIVSLDATGSQDNDAEDGGQAESFVWDFDISVDSDMPQDADPANDEDGVGFFAFPVYAQAGVYTAQLTYTDNDGESDTVLVTINVEDGTSPDLTIPMDAIVECGDPTDPAATGTATADDNCLGQVRIDFQDATNPDCGNTETITRTWTATDASGNQSSDEQEIAVVDTVAPEIRCPPDATVECGDATDPGSLGKASAIDSCNDIAEITFSDEVNFSCGATSEIIRTWEATDTCGNVASCVQTIEVVDTMAPVIECNSRELTVTKAERPGSGSRSDSGSKKRSGSKQRAQPVRITATAFDNCGATTVEILDFNCYDGRKRGSGASSRSASGSGSKSSRLPCDAEIAGDTLVIYETGKVGTIIQWTVQATDECGNVSVETCEAEVTSK